MNRGLKILICICILEINLFSPVFSQDAYPASPYAAKITLNTSTSGAKVTGDITDFPLLIRLNSSNFNFSQAKINGADIRFASSLNIPLSYEIERWDKSAKLAEIWVKVDTVYGNNKSQYINMYWGDPVSKAVSDGEAVFDTANHFAGVWHLGGAKDSTRLDATSNSNDGILKNFDGNKSVTGNIGLADSLQRLDNAHIKISGSESLDNLGPMTYSLWVNLNLLTTGQTFWWKENGNGFFMSGPGMLSFTYSTAGIDPKRETKVGLISENSWIYLTMTWDGTGYGSGIHIYINGIEAEYLNTLGDGTVPGDDSGNDLLLGARDSHSYAVDGALDEIRLSRAIRSVDWIKLCYESQRADQKMVSISAAYKRLSSLSYSMGTNKKYYINTPIGENKLTYSGSQATFVTVTPGLPQGLKIDSLTGSISGTPLKVSGSSQYLVTAYNPAGSANIILTLEVLNKANSILDVMVTPKSAVMGISDTLTFDVLATVTSLHSNGNTDTNSVEVSADNWLVYGKGSIDLTTGRFIPSGFDTCKVIAFYSGLSDTVEVIVDHFHRTIPSGGNIFINMGTEMSVVIPAFKDLEALELYVYSPDELDAPEGTIISGGMTVFNHLTFPGNVRISLKIDTSLVDPQDYDKVQAYRKPDIEKSPWIRYKVNQTGQWISFNPDTLGTFVLAIDTVTPTLKLPFPLNPNQNQSFNVFYQAADNIANPDVVMRLSMGGNTQDSVFSLPFDNGKLMPVTIPAQLVTDKGLSYTVEISDGINKVTGTAQVILQITGALKNPIPLVEGAYQMFAIPLDPVKTAKDLFYAEWGGYNEKLWRLYRYDSSFIEYGADDSYKPSAGEVFWLKTSGFVPQVSLDSGSLQTLPVSPYKIYLHPQWNFVSNPFMFNVGLGDIRSLNSGGPKYVYTYSPEDKSWILETTLKYLEPWKGYLIWNGISSAPLLLELQIPPTAFIPAAAKKPASQETNVGIRVTNGRIGDGYVLAGIHTGSSAEDGLYPKPDFFPKALQIYFNSADLSGKYLADFREKAERGHTWEFTVENSSDAKNTRLEFTGLGALPNAFQAVLLDQERGEAVPLRKSTVDYVHGKSPQEKFTLLIGDEGYIGERISQLLKRFGPALDQNFPNPFRASTTIQYRVPWQSDGKSQNIRVRVEIFDINGKLINSLVNGSQPSGPHTVTWKAIDPTGKTLPSGTYLYRLRMGNEYLGLKKTLLIR